MMTFQNPVNGYLENYNPSTARAWCFLFGPFYFIARGNWKHAALSAVAAVMTFGVSWLIYPFFVNGINLSHYGRQGFVSGDPVVTMHQFKSHQRATNASGKNKEVLFLVIGFVGALIFQELIAYKKGGDCHRTVYSITQNKEGK